MKIKKLKKRNHIRHSGKFYSVLDREAPFAYVEAYKTLRTNLEFVSSVNGAKCFMITSAIPEECKSTTAINLALTLAGSGNSVIMVECDLRKPVLKNYLNIERRTKGLSSVLSADSALQECIVYLEHLGISVIHAGRIPPNPVELLNQEGMKKLIETLKQQYDYVILDAPPVAVVTDAAVIGRTVDGALLVVRSKFAQAKTVRLAKQRLEAVDIKVLGTVLTRFDAKKSGWKSGYDYTDYDHGYSQNRN